MKSHLGRYKTTYISQNEASFPEELFTEYVVCTQVSSLTPRFEISYAGMIPLGLHFMGWVFATQAQKQTSE
jgi:hypothetical protein